VNEFRNVLENFLRDGVLMLKKDSEILKKYPEAAAVVNENPPKFTKVYRILLKYQNLLKIVWEQLQLPPEKCNLPEFEGGQILYGVISDAIHHPILQTVLVSNLASDDLKYFFKVLSSKYKRLYEEFDEVAAGSFDVPPVV